MIAKTFDDFKRLASDPSLTLSEKIDFPDHLRLQYEDAILNEMIRHVPQLSVRNKIILDLGCGCQLVERVYRLCETQNNALVLVDSQEMLNLVPNYPGVNKIYGKFPDLPSFLNLYQNTADGIIVYSVLQYVYRETALVGVLNFIDSAVELLKSGGHLFLGDLPNFSKARRFFLSERGIAYHRMNNNTDELPTIKKEAGDIDDVVILTILQRYREAGYDTYLLPENPDLVMSNRRENILICKI